MPELEQLHAGHAAAVLAFELVNRAYFAASISDRGDEFFEQFPDRHSALLAEQEAGICAFYVLVADDGSVLGRFNLYDIENGTARLGYRVAQQAAGRGVATTAVRELCRIAAARHGLRTLRAATSHDNAASQKVLTKAGFIPVGPATPADLGGKPGTWYQRDLSPSRQETTMAMMGGSSAAEVDAPLEQVRAFVQDVERAPQWQGGLTAMRALERDAGGRAVLCQAEADARVRTIRSVVRFTYDGPAALSWRQERGDLKSAVGRWELEDLGGNRTRVTYWLEVDLGRVLGLVIRGPLVDLLRGMMVDTRAGELKRAVESG